MNATTNILFLLVPEELVGVLLVGMLVAGGFAIMLGARKVGKALVIGAIAFPFISLIATALFNDLFASLPEWLVMPVAFLIMLILYLSAGWIVIKALFGQKAVDEAKGHLLADGVKSTAKMLFSHTGMMVVTGLLVISYVNFAHG